MSGKTSKVFACMLGVLGLALAGPALADVNCVFTLDGVNLGPDGTLAATFTANSVSHYWVLCNVNNTWAGINGSSLSVTPATCTGLHADLLTARVSARSVTLTFPGLSSCAASGLPVNGVPNPYFNNLSL